MKVEEPTKSVRNNNNDDSLLAFQHLPSPVYAQDLTIPQPAPEPPKPEPNLNLNSIARNSTNLSASSNGLSQPETSKFSASFSPTQSTPKREEYTCSICSKIFRSKEGWKIHMERHEGKSRYHCRFCNRGFMAQTHLKAHLSEHTNELPCSCDLCGRKFKYPFTLKKHRAEAHALG